MPGKIFHQKPYCNCSEYNIESWQPNIFLIFFHTAT